MNQDCKQGLKTYPSLFSPFKMGRHTLKNRVVALPVHTGFAYPDGRVSPWMLKMYTELAQSGAGLIIVANAAVSKDGVVSRFNLRADRDRFIPGLSQLANAIKKAGALSCLQLNHAGRFARTRQPLMPSAVSSSNLSFNVEALKRFMEFFPFEKRFGLTRYFLQQLQTWRNAMTHAERDRVITDFADSAYRACQAGFDMVELHGANGYLLCQYLSSFTNKIEAEVGGDFSRRAAFPLQVVKKVKEILPADFTIGFRLILKEWVPKGIELPEAVLFAKLLEKSGVAYLSASVGSYNSIFSPDAIKAMADKAYMKKDMQLLTSQVGIPTIASGRIAQPSLGDMLVREGVADLVGLGRPLRVDTQWVKKAKENRKKIKICVNCNWCLKQVVLENGFNCSRWSGVEQERTRLAHQLLTRNYNALWVVSDLRDIQIYKACWPLICPEKKEQRYPTLIGLSAFENDKVFNRAQRDFILWVKTRLDPLGLYHMPLNYNICEHKSNWENTLSNEITSEEYGQVFLGLNQMEPWRARMLYKESGKVFALLSSNKNLNRVFVPVDFSPATLLVMTFLQQSLMQKKAFEFTFLYIRSDHAEAVTPQWEKFKKIAGFDKNIPLQIVSPRADISSALLEIIEAKKYGTIIMGKRGLSGIKRLLLGSVSSGVLRNLTDQTLFLID